ncbi:MAG: transglutaminase family protein [Thermodesulfobacteriota bacterium]
MLYKIEHITRYAYSKEVFLEPHIVRLRPRSDCSQVLKNFEISVKPTPTGISEIIDAGGDSIFLWFEELTDSLEITCTSEVETKRENPFDYILATDRAHRLPMEYKIANKRILEPYRFPSSDYSEDFEGFVAKILLESENSSMKFLSTLTNYIFDNFEHEIREEGPAREPEETLSRKKGSCRDFVVLFAEAARSMGFASRFVSGYTEGDLALMQNHLHAWAEVYLPGGGWRGYDPTLGLAVSDQHIAVTTGASPKQAAPVSGSFRGTGAEAIMGYEISISK